MAGSEDIFHRAINDGHSAAWDQNWTAAAEAYQRALKEFPDDPKALNSYALALYQLQQYDEALKIYKRVAQVTPEDPVAFEKIAQLNERLGNLKEAVQAAVQSAELYLKVREVEKSIENWLRVVQLNPEHITARSRLALIHEKTGQTRQAITEYIALASLLQHGGNPQKALEVVEYAMRLDSSSQEVVQAASMIKSGRLLNKPMRPRGGTGPLRMAAVKEFEQKETVRESPDPVTEASQKALTVLAEVLFDLSDDSAEAQARRGLASIMKNTGQLPSQQAEQTKILLHLSQAIDSQTRNQEAAAADEVEHAIESGFSHPAAYFDLGFLRSQTSRQESALRNLQQCLKHSDYALAARLLSGQVLRTMNRGKEAAIQYLEALKIADAEVVPPEQSDTIRQLYEPLIETLGRDTDEKAFVKLCENVEQMLMRVNWRQHLIKMREEMSKQQEGQALPLAEVVIQAQSSQVIDAMNQINQLARENHLRSAMDDAFHALMHAPTYLPLHSLIGELLIREGRTQEAISKFTTVANAYSIRGEAAQATNLLKRIIQFSPMDMAARTRLIEQLIARGLMDEAVSEYMDLADIYYRLAELDMARKTYTTALRIAQQPAADRQWSVRILRHMADIDMQRLDWRQAIRIFEQIRTLRPDDAAIRENLIELNLRLAQPQQAQAELESFISYLESAGHLNDSIPFLEKLLEEHSDVIMLRRTLAEQLYRAGRLTDAVAQLDAVGDRLMETGNKEGVAEIIRQILAMNPPNSEDYRNLLAQL
jgi:tetratricopeptide (TPR) repeat protein